jgi:hypothetical protein
VAIAVAGLYTGLPVRLKVASQFSAHGIRREQSLDARTNALQLKIVDGIAYDLMSPFR